jgi:3-oxoadipate enol-lactonase
MPFIHANGIQLYYEIKGNGLPLLIISGTGSDLRHPRPKDPPLMDFQVLRYDQRGLGQSDKPHTFYSMTDYADDAEALLNKL